MATVRQAISEHDVVALREPLAERPAGTTGVVISLDGDAVLLEIADAEGRTLDPIRVPAAGLEIKRR